MALPINLRSTPARGTQGLRQLDDPAPGQFDQCDPATHIFEAPADTSPVEPIAYLARQAGACHAHILSHAQPYPLDDLPGKLAPCHKHGIMLAPIGLRVQQQMWDTIRAKPGAFENVSRSKRLCGSLTRPQSRVCWGGWGG